MTLYHGSGKNGLTTLRPYISDHGKPYVYFTDCFNLAVMYAAKNPINTYWFKDGVLHYDEYFEGQFEALHDGNRARFTAMTERLRNMKECRGCICRKRRLTFAL